MKLQQDCIPLNERADWVNALAPVHHAFSSTWENCYAMHLTTGYPTFLYRLEYGNTVVTCPVAERSHHGHTDILTPFGFSGFAGTDTCPEFVNIWEDFVRSRGYICGYIGQHPLFFDPSYCKKEDIFEYNTLYIFDLSYSTDELFMRLSTNRKRQLKNWAREDICCEKERLKSFFLEHYHDCMQTRNASSIYDLSHETLSFLLGQENIVLAGMPATGPIEAVSAFTYTNDIGHYLFNVALPEGRPYATPLIWHAVHELKSRGIEKFNLGGSITGDDNDKVAEYKRRFNVSHVPLFCIKQIYRPDIYKQLCADVNIDASDKNGYFPGYHKP